MTKADEFIKWVEDTKPDFKQRDHEDIICEFDPLTGYGIFWNENATEYDFYDDITEVHFTDGTLIQLNYKGEVIYQA